MSIIVANVWISLDDDLKGCMQIFQFKKMYEYKVIRLYEMR